MTSLLFFINRQPLAPPIFSPQISIPTVRKIAGQSRTTLFMVALCLIWPFPCLSAPAADTISSPLAIIDGHTITQADVEMPLSTRLHRLREEIYQLQHAQLSNLIAEQLLKDEADKRRIPVKELINAEVLSKLEPVTQQEIDEYYEKNRSSFGTAPQDQIKAGIQTNLQQQRAYERTLQYAETLKPQHKLQIFLKEPELPRVNVSVGNSPVQGNANAPVTIIEFSDYQCPSCKKEHAILLQLRDKYRDKIRWVYKDFPLGMNEASMKASEAAYCANEQLKFWEYQELLFSSQEEPTLTKLQEIASALNLDRSAFDSCLSGSKYRPLVIQNVKEARSIGIDRTPSFVINNRLISGGPTLARFEKIIDQEVARKSSAGKKKQ